MKTLLVRVSNADLNALENLLYCQLKPREKTAAEKKVKKLWRALVGAWDKKVR